jgi:hypothetical protein
LTTINDRPPRIRSKITGAMNGAWTIALLAIALLVSCDRGSEIPTPESPPVSTAPTSDGVLSSYESIRASLASDDVEPVRLRAQGLARQAGAAALNATGVKSELDAIAKSAGELAERANEIEMARRAFGELSKHVIALLVAEPKLRENRIVCECPMAPGYKKWVQPSGKLQNPYMGMMMLECSKESDWSS